LKTYHLATLAVGNVSDQKQLFSGIFVTWYFEALERFVLICSSFFRVKKNLIIHILSFSPEKVLIKIVLQLKNSDLKGRLDFYYTCAYSSVLLISL
jgi:hypothetical protein